MVKTVTAKKTTAKKTTAKKTTAKKTTANVGASPKTAKKENLVVPMNELQLVPIDNIIPDNDVRGEGSKHSDAEIRAMADVIKRDGRIIQTPAGYVDSRDNDKVHIIDGRKRLEACKLLGWKTFPVIVGQAPGTKAGKLLSALSANINIKTMTRSEILAVHKQLTASGLPLKDVELACGLAKSTGRLFRQIEETLNEAKLEPETVKILMDFLPVATLRSLTPVTAKAIAEHPEVDKALKEIKKTGQKAPTQTGKKSAKNGAASKLNNAVKKTPEGQAASKPKGKEVPSSPTVTKLTVKVIQDYITAQLSHYKRTIQDADKAQDEETKVKATAAMRALLALVKYMDQIEAR